MKLYLVPNMGHCGGNASTDRFDMLTPMVNWIENGIAPNTVVATGVNFSPVLGTLTRIFRPRAAARFAHTRRRFGTRAPKGVTSALPRTIRASPGISTSSTIIIATGISSSSTILSVSSGFPHYWSDRYLKLIRPARQQVYKFFAKSNFNDKSNDNDASKAGGK